MGVRVHGTPRGTGHRAQAGARLCGVECVSGGWLLQGAHALCKLMSRVAASQGVSQGALLLWSTAALPHRA